MDKTGCLVLLCSILHCKGLLRLGDQLEDLKGRPDNEDIKNPSRRYRDLEGSTILGAPDLPSHLPEAEPILPGHTLLRPALGMLKSAVKFPHRDPDNGAGVYGNIDTLGISYGGRNDRVLYSGFRRKNRVRPKYIVIVPVKTKKLKPKFILSSAVLNLNEDDFPRKSLLNALRNNKRQIKIMSTGPKYFKPKKTLFVNRPKNRVPQQYFYKSALRTVKEYESSENQNQQKKAKTYAKLNDKKYGVIKSKKKWFWDTKTKFNHVKIHQDALEQVDLIPANVSNNLRNWWFFHQDDYRPFTGMQE